MNDHTDPTEPLEPTPMEELEALIERMGVLTVVAGTTPDGSIAVPRPILQAVFDLATRSPVWDEGNAESLRTVALLLGNDPLYRRRVEGSGTDE